MAQLLWVCLGGAVGTAARYGLTAWSLRAFGAAFPFGTLAVNVIGSFLMSLLMHVALATDRISPVARVALATGVLGGFTTYSSFNFETLLLAERGAWGLAAANVAGTVAACVLAGVAGLAVGRALFG